MNQKNTIRKEIKAQNLINSQLTLTQCHQDIFNFFLKPFNNKDSFFLDKKIALFSPLKTEMNLDLFFNFFEQSGAQLFFPKILDLKTSEMLFHKASPLHSAEWKIGPFGILEPDSNSKTTHDFSIMFVPAVAINSRGYRIGNGKGFYDRYLTAHNADLSQSLKICCVHDFQLRDDFYEDSWDHKVDWIITNKKEIRLEGFEYWCNKNL